MQTPTVASPLDPTEGLLSDPLCYSHLESKFLAPTLPRTHIQPSLPVLVTSLGLYIYKDFFQRLCSVIVHISCCSRHQHK